VRGLVKYYPANDLVGLPYTDLELPDHLTGQPVRFGDHHEPGKLLAVLYWSPRCPYSRQAMPSLVAAHRTYAPRFFNMISVVRDGTPEEIQERVAAFQVKFPILADRDKQFTTLYRVVSTPTLVIIGPDGTVDSVYTSGKVNYLPVIWARVNSLIVSRNGTSGG
jgi:thiol-disulfide isomerase/thioredoxin